MKCKDIERLIVDSSEDVLSSEDLYEIEQHVSKCAKCTRFQEDMRKIRLYLDETTIPEPSAELVKQTQLLCHTKLKTRDVPDRKSVDQTLLTRIPKLVWAALMSLIIMTVVWMFPLLDDFKLELPLSFHTMAALFLMIQNAAMLFFAPILIRKYPLKNQDFKLV